MKKAAIQYGTGDEILVRGVVEYAQVYRDKVYYKIAEAEELIPQEKVEKAPKRDKKNRQPNTDK